MAEAIMVIQVVFSGVVVFPRFDPIQQSLTTLWYGNNPYNIYYSDGFRPFDDPLLPERLRGTELYSQFVYNINTSLIFVFVPIIGGIVLFFFRFCSCLNGYKKMKKNKICRLLLGEYVFAGLTVICCITACSTVLEIKYGKDGEMISLTICGIICLLIVLYLVFWLKLNEKFG